MRKTKKDTGRKAKRAGPKKAPTAAEAPTWAVLKGEELNWPGAPLLALLIDAGNTRGLSVRELAEDHLGMTYSHFTLLRKGQRSMARLGDETIGKIAHFLGLPKVIVMLAGGHLKLEDFYQDPRALEAQLQPALEFIQQDPEFGPYMPPSAFVADVALRQFILLLYEKASGRSLIPARTSLADIVKTAKPA